MNGILGIYYRKDKENNFHYRCCGSGEKYRQFYKWINDTSYRCTSEDFPWDFFVFDNPIDHIKLLQTFPEDVYEDKD